MSLETSHPTVQNETFKEVLFHERNVAFGGEYTNNELEVVEQIVLATSEHLTDECKSQNKTGFMVSVALNNKSIISVQIGEIDQEDPKYAPDGKKVKYLDFSRAKVSFLQYNTKCSRSSQNNSSLDSLGGKTTLYGENVVGGAVAFDNGYIIGISGLSSDPIDDEDASLKIGRILGFKESISNII